MKVCTLSRLVFVLLVFGALVVSACNTVGGMGRDLQSAGNSMEHSSSHR